MDSYDDYYLSQVGSGLPVFEGLQYQRGHGFFGSLFSNIIKPLGRYLGRTALNTGVKLGSDFLSGENFKDSLKKNLKLTGEKMLDDGYARVKKFAQTGSGRRRRRRRKSKNKSKSSFKRRVTKKRKSVIKKQTKRKVSKRNRKKRKSKKVKFDLF